MKPTTSATSGIPSKTRRSGVQKKGLPRDFCEVNLPKADTMIVLEDESGREYETRYLARKVGLSVRWKGFSTDHNLVLGDALVFHLIRPSKFKVYISVKSHGSSNEVEVARSHPQLASSSKQHDSCVARGNTSSCTRTICDFDKAPSGQHENIGEEENFGLQVVKGNRLVRSVTNFQEITSIDNFNIVANGLILGSQLPQHLKVIKYYELCLSQQMFLHEHLLEGQNYQLVIGMICETINIADNIKAGKITTPLDSFDMLHRKLKCLEIWSMNDSFLLARLNRLMHLASKAKEYKEARNHRERAEEEKKYLELKLEDLKENVRRLDREIDSLNENFNMLEAKFQGLADAPW